MNENLIIPIKRKNIQLMIDYCLENKNGFTVRHKNGEEWELEMEINSIKKAIQLGMFLRENRIEVPGFTEVSKPATATKPGKKEDKNSHKVVETLDADEIFGDFPSENSNGKEKSDVVENDSTLKFD
ncbi:MAG: hypothetical protein V2A54_12320 [Bacteroidota bacterium]